MDPGHSGRLSSCRDRSGDRASLENGDMIRTLFLTTYVDQRILIIHKEELL